MKRSRWILVLGILILIALGAGIFRARKSPAQSFREMPVQKGDLALTVLSTGTVQPENRLEIKSPIAGRVEQVLVREGQRVKKGQILAWMSSTERAAMLDAARSQGGDEVKRWEDMYRPAPVVAPIDGTIILRSIESGQTFTTSDAILVMSDRLTVKAQVDETDMAQVKLKQPAEIILDAYPGQKIPGKVVQIAFEATTVNNVTTYVVAVLPVKTPDFMRSGMTANVNILIESHHDVILAPTEAITQKNGESTLLIKGSDGQPIERTVHIGANDGKRTEIIDGLTLSDIVLAPALASAKPKAETNANPFAPPRIKGRPR